MYYLFLLSRSMNILRFTNIAIHINNCSFILRTSVPFHGYTTVCYLFMWWWIFGLFLVWGYHRFFKFILQIKLLWTLVCSHFSEFISLGWILKDGRAESWYVYVTFWRKWQTFAKWTYHFSFLTAVFKSFSYSTSSLTSGVISLLNLAILTVV